MKLTFLCFAWFDWLGSNHQFSDISLVTRCQPEVLLTMTFWWYSCSLCWISPKCSLACQNKGTKNPLNQSFKSLRCSSAVSCSSHTRFPTSRKKSLCDISLLMSLLLISTQLEAISLQSSAQTRESGCSGKIICQILLRLQALAEASSQKFSSISLYLLILLKNFYLSRDNCGQIDRYTLWLSLCFYWGFKLRILSVKKTKLGATRLADLSLCFLHNASLTWSGLRP